MESPSSDTRWKVIALVAIAISVCSTLSLIAVLTLSPKGTPTPTPTPTFQLFPTAQSIPTPAVASWPSPDPSLNFAGGDFVVVDGWNGCKVRVQLAATSRPDYTGSTGAFTLAGVGPDCQGQPGGQAAGRITCLIVSGNFAKLSGWLDESSGMFTMANVLRMTLTQNDPQQYGPTVSRAGVGLAGGSPECPPAIEGKGPQIISGTLQVWQARS